jgi:hypothetical protein
LKQPNVFLILILIIIPLPHPTFSIFSTDLHRGKPAETPTGHAVLGRAGFLGLSGRQTARAAAGRVITARILIGIFQGASQALRLS